MVARYYSSGLGRFLAVDPGDDTALEDPQSWNKYAYVRNNPLKYNDPDGEALNLVAAGIGIVAGGAIGGGIELGKQLWNGEDVNWQDVGAAAAGGALTGAVAGLTAGAGLALEVMGGAAGATLGGAANRSMDTDPETEAYDPKAMAVDAAGGAAGVAGAKLVGGLVGAATGASGTAAGAETGRQLGKAAPLIKKGAEKVGKAAGKAAGREAAEQAVDNEKKIEEQNKDQR